MNIPVERFMGRFKHDTPLTSVQFHRYSKNNQRRIIACDALRLLLAKKTQPAHLYVYMGLNGAPNNGQASQYFKQKNSANCSVCALGALLTGHIMALNDCTVVALINSDRVDIIDTLNSVFNADTLILIEAYYERSAYDLRDEWDNETIVHIERFEAANMDDYTSISMLLENIIEHGDFYPYEMSF